MASNSNGLTDQQCDVVTAMGATAGTKRKLSAKKKDARKRRGTESRNGDEDDCASNIDTEQENDTSDSDGGDDDLESEGDDNVDLGECFFGHGADMLEEDENEEDEEDYDEFQEFKWLKAINISITETDAADSPQIGHCKAMLIDREQIRAGFHRDMEEPNNDTASVGFGVFDRWGCLRPELQNHPIKKGTGVWGPELNDGRFLQIETLLIKEEYQRKGYGTKLFHQVWEKAQDLAIQEDKERKAARKKGLESIWKDTPAGVSRSTEVDDEFVDLIDERFRPGEKTRTGCEFAIIWATILNTHAVETEPEKLSPAQKDIFYQKKQDSLEDFWRAMGFRRIGSSQFLGLARDLTHASHLLAPQNDYMRPTALNSWARIDG